VTVSPGSTVTFSNLPASLLQGWIDNPASNHGLLLLSTTDVDDQDIAFASRESKTPTGPELTFATVPKPCTLSDTASYSSTLSTLTMRFTIGNNLGTPAIWNAWLTYADLQGTDPDTMQLLFSKSQPITNPPTTSTATYSLPKEGLVGVLSTLSTPPRGIVCYSWVRVNTGTEAPAISSFSPTSGPVGTKVVITGQSLTGATSVTFGGVKASFTLNSDTQITATVPSGAKTGKIVVTAPGGTATSAGTFTVP
jgi:hypothetical protein